MLCIDRLPTLHHPLGTIRQFVYRAHGARTREEHSQVPSHGGGVSVRGQSLWRR
jgi:hypothetical protein